MPDYIRLIGEHYYDPSVGAYVAAGADPTVYANIVWIDTPILQATLDALVQDDTLESEVIARLAGLATSDILRWDGTNFVPEGALKVEKDDAQVSEANVLNFEGDVTVVDEGTKTTISVAQGGGDLASVCAQIAISDGDQALGTNTWDTVNFPTTQVESDNTIVSHDPITNNSRLTFSQAGAYLIYYNATLDPPAGTAIFDTRIILNGVLTPVAGSERRMSEDNEANDLTNVFCWEAAANDYLELQVRSDIASSAVMVTTNFGATRLRGGQGADGTDGAQGIPGSGSTITLEEGGVAVTNTPHDTIDFDTSDFDVTDNGDGSATVTVIGGGLAADMDAAQARRTTTYTVTGAWANITHDATDVENATTVVEHDNTNTERLTLKETGLYLIYYGMSVTATSGVSEAFAEVQTRIQVNGAGGALGGSEDMIEQVYDGSIVGDNTLQQNMIRSFIYEAMANDFVTLQMQEMNVVGTLTLGATNVVFGAVRLKGPKGDAGPAGGGSVIVQEEGVTVTGGPHDTLNYIGGSVTATDGTGGVANITVTDQNLTANDALQARRSTTFTVTSAFQDVNFDATDVETDAAVIEHNNTNTDDIDIKVSGTYEITYGYDVDGTNLSNNDTWIILGRVRLDDTSVINGSSTRQVVWQDSSVASSNYQWNVARTFMVNITAPAVVTLQVDGNDIAAGGGTPQLFADSVIFMVKRLK